MPQDLDLLQGSWTIDAMEVDGQEMPDAMVAGRIVVQGDRFTSLGMGAVYEGTLRLDASTAPRQIDMKFDAGPEKGNSNPGIYELNGDAWRLCLATRGSVRPRSFATMAGSGFALETLTRAEARVAAKAKARVRTKRALAKRNTPPATEFEGEWRMVSGIMNGSPMDQSVVQWVKRVTQGNQTTVYAGPQVMMKFEFTRDSSKSPKTIDYLNLAGPNKGKAQRGIYKLDGDLLTVFIAAPGGARPTEFRAAPGDGGTLTVWKRG